LIIKKIKINKSIINRIYMNNLEELIKNRNDLQTKIYKLLNKIEEIKDKILEYNKIIDTNCYHDWEIDKSSSDFRTHYICRICSYYS
jgi:hypothetical protein